MLEPLLYIEDLAKAIKKPSARAPIQPAATSAPKATTSTSKPTPIPKTTTPKTTTPKTPKPSTRATTSTTPRATTGNVAKPDTPTSPEASGKSGRKGMEPCPFGGGADCIAHGGNGAKTHKTGGAIAQAHASYAQKRSPEAVKTKDTKDSSASKPDEWDKLKTAIQEENWKREKEQIQLRIVSSGDKEAAPVSSTAKKIEQSKVSGGKTNWWDVEIEPIPPHPSVVREREKKKDVRSKRREVYEWQKKNPGWKEAQLVEGKTFIQHSNESLKFLKEGKIKEALESSTKAKHLLSVVKDHPNFNQKDMSSFKKINSNIVKEAKKQSIKLKPPKPIAEAPKAKDKTNDKPNVPDSSSSVSTSSDTGKKKEVTAPEKKTSTKAPEKQAEAPTAEETAKKRKEVAATNAKVKEKKKKAEEAAAATAPPSADSTVLPADEQDKKPAKKPEGKKINYASVFDRGRLAGTRFAEAAATAEAGGYILSGGVEYGVGGAIRVGQHLLNSKTPNTDKKPEDKKPSSEPSPPKGAQVAQSSMKSLPLYLDLFKAIQMPNVGHTTPDDRKARIQHDASYAKRPVGIASSDVVTEDDPDKGKRWRSDSSEADTVQARVDEELKVKKEKEEEEKEDKPVDKSLDPIGFLKSLNLSIQEELSYHLPNSMEALFMIKELEYDPILVSKGQLAITGKDRHRFNEWAHSRLSKSLISLTELTK
jgi:hypothetical protein